MELEYKMIIGMGGLGAILGALALMSGAEVPGFTGIGFGVLAILIGTVGSMRHQE